MTSVFPATQRAILERRLLNALTTKADPDLSSFDWDNLGDDWTEAVEAELAQAFASAFLVNAAPMDRTKAQDYAVSYARERAGELLSGKDSIPQATYRRLQELVSQTIDEGGSIGALKARIAQDLVFSPGRAKTIAVTETAYALGAGSKQAASDQGQDEKSWVTSDDEDVDEECIGNAGDDWISIDDVFSSGDDTIPAHPNCRCDVIYRTAALHGEDDSSDDEGDVQTDAVSGAVLREVHCPKCERRLPVNNLKGEAEVYCRRCNETFTIGAGQSGRKDSTPKKRRRRVSA